MKRASETTTIRLGRRAHEDLRDIAEAQRLSLQGVMESLIERERRERFLRAANQAYRALRADVAAWVMEQQERVAWDVTLGDEAAALSVSPTQESSK